MKTSRKVKNPPKKVQKKCETEYSVVRFNDKNVKMFECVPNVWFVDKHRKSCYWPPRTGKAFLLRALSRETPKGWKKYDCVVVSSGHATYNSGYEIVKEKCAQKCNTSSADEQQELLRHQRQHPVLAATKAKSFENVFADKGRNKNQTRSGKIQKKRDEDDSDEVHRCRSRSPLRSRYSSPASSNHSHDNSKSQSLEHSKQLISPNREIYNSQSQSSKNDTPCSTPRRRSISPSRKTPVSHPSLGSISKPRSRSRSFSQRSRSPSKNTSISNSSRGSISKSRSRSGSFTQRSRSPSNNTSISNSSRGSISKSRSRSRTPQRSLSPSHHSISSRRRATSSNSNYSGSKSRSQSRSATREGSVATCKPNTTRRSLSISQRSDPLTPRIQSQTKKPKVLVAASGSIFKEIRDIHQSLKENNQRIDKNDRRLTRMEVTLNKVFIMVGDLKNAVNSNNTSKVGTAAVANSNEIPRGFKVPDFPVEEMAQLVRLNRSLRDGQFRLFLLTQEKNYCAPSRQSDSVIMTAYLRRFISLQLREQIHLVDAKGKDEPTLKTDFPEVYKFLTDVMILGYKDFKTQIKSADAHMALRTVWGRTKQMLREQKK